MTEVTRILSAIEKGELHAANQLLPLVYEELRQLAAQKLAHEKPGQTLQATALVHEAYLRLVDVNRAEHWDSRGHFFAAAAEAMRRILVENARRKRSLKHGGRLRRQGIDGAAITTVRCRTEPAGVSGQGGQFRQMPPYLEGIRLGNRWAVIYSKYDIGCALEKHPSTDCLGHDHPSALKLASAAVLYALKR